MQYSLVGCIGTWAVCCAAGYTALWGAEVAAVAYTYNVTVENSILKA